MKYLPSGFFCCLWVASSALAQSIHVNEIMFHPAPAAPEDTGLEWIELHNAGTNAVDISGWRLDAGVTFVFPTNTVMPAGGYLVVAADVSKFQSHYPTVTNVVGDWVGQLSNTGEQIRLRDAEGEDIDSVRYADSGDWAVRRRVPDPIARLPSWDWFSAADGQGRSLEMVNLALPHSAG